MIKTSTKAALLTFAGMTLLASLAMANAGGAQGRATLGTRHGRPVILADVVVQGTQPQAAAPAPAPAPVLVQAREPAAPLVDARPPRATVIEHENKNYMSTLLVSALSGAVLGALVGGAVYYLADHQTQPRHIIYWAAGGVLVGGGVGLAQIVVQESRIDRVASRPQADPAPTFRLALFSKSF
jgi:hypothetical protein